MQTGPAFMNVHESHVFVFPVVDFNGKANNTIFSGEALKLPSTGNWWIHAVNATRVTTGAAGEMASGSNMDLNIFDSGLGQYWWTAGNPNPVPLFPIQLVAGKAGKPGVFSESKFVKAGSTLTPYLRQRSGATPTGSSLLYITVVATLADSSEGNLPILPALGGVIAQNKGSHYKANLIAPFETTNLNAGASLQLNLPLNRDNAMIVCALNTDFAFTDTSNLDPRTSDPHVLVNMFDTRTTWKWASPAGIPITLFYGNFASHPFVAPSFFYIEADQNLAVEIVNNTSAALATNVNFVFDGYLQENVLGERIR